MRSISASDSLSLSLVIVIDLDPPLPRSKTSTSDHGTAATTHVPLSAAPTFMIPFASISNVTSICGIPLGAGRIPDSSNLPSRLLSFVNDRSPSNTWIRTVGWLSTAVENLHVAAAGYVLLPPQYGSIKEKRTSGSSWLESRYSSELIY